MLRLPIRFGSKFETTASAVSASRQAGFTIMEIIIVLGILGGLMAAVISGIVKQSGSAKVGVTKTKLTTIQQTLVKYQLDLGKMPETKDGLGALLNNPGSSKWQGPYVEREADIRDDWDNPVEYELTPKGVKLTSNGPDGQPGTGDDIVFVNGREAENAGGGAPAQGNQ